MKLSKFSAHLRMVEAAFALRALPRSMCRLFSMPFNQHHPAILFQTLSLVRFREA
jgi:hypothetical protein